MLAFVIGGAVAGGVGALFTSYVGVLCPTELAVSLSVNLLVMLFLGGVGSLRGVVVGAVAFTALPEILRMAPTWRMVIYGLLLLLIVIRAPDGLEGVIRRRSAARASSAARSPCARSDCTSSRRARTKSPQPSTRSIRRA